MARVKGIPHTSSSSADTCREIATINAYDASTILQRQALLRADELSSIHVLTGGGSGHMQGAQDPQSSKTVPRILYQQEPGDGRSEGYTSPRTNRAMELLPLRGARQKEQEAVEQDTTTIHATYQYHPNIGADTRLLDEEHIQQNVSGVRLTVRNLSTIAISTEDVPYMREFDEMSSVSTLTQVSDVTALDPEYSPPALNPVCTFPGKKTTTYRKTHEENTRRVEVGSPSVQNEGPDEDETALSGIISDHVTHQPQSRPTHRDLSRALSTLQYDDNPSWRPGWLTGLRKPLPHPDLTVEQNFEIQTRFWHNELNRLHLIRRDLTVPKDADKNGEWHYEHFGKIGRAHV